MWESVLPRAVYTYCTLHGAARFDRIYVTSNVSDQKVGVETVFASFTDQLAVCLRIKLEVPLLQGGRGLWKMNTKLLEDTDAVFSRSGQSGDYRNENTRTGLRGGRNMSNGKSFSFSSKKGLRGLEKI